MRMIDFYRFPRRRHAVGAVLVLLGLPTLLYVQFGYGAGAPPKWNPIQVLCYIIFCLSTTLPFIGPWLPLSGKKERQKRAWYQARYPGECVHCGYDIRYCPGPNCPECGDVLPEKAQEHAADRTTSRHAPMRVADFCRFRRWQPVVVACAAAPFVLLVMFVILSAVEAVSLHPNPTVVAAWGVVAGCCTWVMFLDQRPLSKKREQRLRAWLQARYPGECVRCGYNTHGLDGPDCRECSEALGENQGRRAPAPSGPQTG